jgi:hypothetical protein
MVLQPLYSSLTITLRIFLLVCFYSFWSVQFYVFLVYSCIWATICTVDLRTFISTERNPHSSQGTRYMPICNPSTWDLFLWCQIMFHCMNMPYFIYHFISRWVDSIFWLLILLWMCNSFVGMCFRFSCTRSRIDASYGNSIFNILRNYRSVFQCSCTFFTFPPATCKLPILPYSCQHSNYYVLLDYSHTRNGYDVYFHCGFDLLLSDCWLHLASFSFAYCHFYVFGEMFVQILSHFQMRLFVFTIEF